MDTEKQLGIMIPLTIHFSADLCSGVSPTANHTEANLEIQELLQGTDVISCLNKPRGRIMGHDELLSCFF